MNVRARIVDEALSAFAHVREAAPHCDSARRRNVALRRQLVVADVAAGVATGALTAVSAGLAGIELAAITVAVAIGWPLIASVCGLHVAHSLGAWATGV